MFNIYIFKINVKYIICLLSLHIFEDIRHLNNVNNKAKKSGVLVINFFKICNKV